MYIYTNAYIYMCVCIYVCIIYIYMYFYTDGLTGLDSSGCEPGKQTAKSWP